MGSFDTKSWTNCILVMLNYSTMFGWKILFQYKIFSTFVYIHFYEVPIARFTASKINGNVMNENWTVLMRTYAEQFLFILINFLAYCTSEGFFTQDVSWENLIRLKFGLIALVNDIN